MRDIVLVTVDSLRADHVGWHGYERDTTPNLDRWADSSGVFTDAFSHACSTRPSFPAIMTSSYPLMYGGYERLSEQRTTIAEALHQTGYETAGFHSNLYLSADFGYDRGFDQFFDSKTDPSMLAKARQAVKTHLDDEGIIYNVLQRMFNATEKRTGIELGSAYVEAADITDRALEWVQDAPESPRFLWVHYMDVHHPYVPPKEHQRCFRDQTIDDRDAVQLRRKMLEAPDEITDEELQSLIDLYDAEIRYVDEEIERLLDSIRSHWGEDVIFAFTADHGEEFLDHGRFSHAATFYDEVLHVPLLLSDGDLGGTYDDLVGLLDIAPTLLEYAGGEQPEEFYGESLLRVESGDRSRDDVIAEWADLETGERRFGVRTPEWKYIVLEDDTKKLYNLRDDPDETDNLIDKVTDMRKNLQERVREHERLLEDTKADIGDVHMDEEVQQRLRDLGYQE